jgi:hypothetical protein
LRDAAAFGKRGGAYEFTTARIFCAALAQSVGGLGREDSDDLFSNDDAATDVRHAKDGDAPSWRALGDQGVGAGDGRAGALFKIADLRLECGQLWRGFRGVAVAARRSNLRCAGARLVSSPIRCGFSNIIVLAGSMGGGGTPSLPRPPRTGAGTTTLSLRPPTAASAKFLFS